MHIAAIEGEIFHITGIRISKNRQKLSMIPFLSHKFIEVRGESCMQEKVNRYHNIQRD